MNLVKEPWIPVLFVDGHHDRVSLHDAFARGDAISDLAVNPIQRIALMRLLVCIAQAALDGPADEEDWLACRKGLAQRCLEYLDKWGNRFDLYGERPFLQATDVVSTNNATVDKLEIGLAAGNNTTLFDHAATPDRRNHESARRALSLLVYQCFSTCGLIGTTTWSGKKTAGTSEHAPATDGSALHAILRGESLLETIHANMLTDAMIAALPGGKRGAPIWQVDTLGLQTRPDGYLDRLVPMARAIHMDPESTFCTLADGLHYPKLPAGREPWATVMTLKAAKGPRPAYVPTDVSRHPWRELASILALGSDTNHAGPLTLTHLQTLKTLSFDLWLGGVAAAKNKILDMAEWTFTIPAGMLNDAVLVSYQRGVALAKGAEDVLVQACKTDWHELKRRENLPLPEAKNHFWSRLDATYHILMAACISSNADADAPWRHEVNEAMRAAYEQACPHDSPRQLQAYAIGLRHLHRRPAERRADSLRTRSSVADAEQVR